MVSKLNVPFAYNLLPFYYQKPSTFKMIVNGIEKVAISKDLLFTPQKCSV